MKTSRVPLWMVVFAFGVLGASANELANPNLDTVAIQPGGQDRAVPTGWVVEAAKTISGTHYDSCSSEPWCNVLDPGGFGLFFKPFQGDASAGDLISVRFYQDNPAAPGTKYTLSGYAAGEANYCGFYATNSPAPQSLFVIQFLDASSTVLASNAFDLLALGLPMGGGGSMAQLTTPQVTAPPGTATVRAGAFMLDAYSTSGGQGFFVDAFDLTAEAPPGAPVITNQPAHKTVALGANATFNVGVSNAAGASYQWQFYGTNLSDGGNLSGTLTSTLTITGVSAADVGHYRVRVTNVGGSVLSSDATLAITGINFYPVISITGKIGDTYRVDYSTALAPTTWIPLSTNLLTTSPQLILDTTAAGNNTRFYQAVFLY